MPAKREVRCEVCGANNRVSRYSFRQIPNCGNCHNPLREQSAIKALRGLYRWRRYFVGLSILASPLMFFAWVGSNSSTTANPTAIDACANRPQPREGVYKWYGRAWGDDIAELTVQTAFGSNYFIKLEDMSGRPARAYFMHGGSIQSYPVPVGTFALKYATGQSWCSESELFGQTTATNQADKTFTFEDDTHWTVELILQRHGNLGTHSIPRSQF